LNDKNQTAVIDTFLMSCRIIGRNIEYAFIDYLVDMMKRNNINEIQARYIKTQKNGQVKTFFDKCSFRLTDSNESVRNYTLVVSEYKPRLVNYIEVLDGKQFG
jgi:predicted enzyme involved in methoxymalonyl-ACP biosynthesis